MSERPANGGGALAKVATGSYFARMRVVGIKLLKNKLSEYVRLAASGERVLVTDRDKVVAELIAPRPDPDPMMDNPWWADEVRKGNIAPAKIRLHEPPASLPPALRLPFDQLMRELDEDRADR